MSLGVFRSFAPALLAQSQLSCKCSILNIMGDAAEQQSYMEDGTQPYPEEEMAPTLQMSPDGQKPEDILECFVEEEAFPPPPPPHLQI